MALSAQGKQDARADDDAPAAAAPTPSYPGLKAAVIVMGVLLVVGFIVVFATIIQRAGNFGTERAGGESVPAAAFDTVRSIVPAGTQIGAMTLDGDRLAVQAQGSEGTWIILFDVTSGRETGRILLARD